jgi:uncharacterized phage-like protein YoqJ
MSICLFTGHRDLPQDTGFIAQKLDRAIEKLWLQAGVDTWLCGGAVGFDLLAGERVLALKEKYPALRLHMVLPCREQDKRYSPEDKARYAALLAGADAVEWLSPHYYRGCMLARDRVMVDRAEGCVCWLLRSEGGTAYTVRLAVNKGLPLYNIAEDTAP